MVLYYWKVINLKKISRIKYNGKIFDIFSENHKKIFFEVKIINGVEKYFYVTKMDDIYLNKIYNKFTPVFYSSKIKDKLFISGLIVATTLEVFSLRLRLNKDNKYDNTPIYIEVKDSDRTYIPNISGLDNYGMQRVTFEDLKNTLSENNNIPSEYKKYINDYIDDLEEKLPLVDLRILNANIKQLKVEIIDTSEWQEEKAVGYTSYSFGSTTITLKNEYYTQELQAKVIYHELSHILREMYYKTNDTIIVYFYNIDNFGKSIHEAITDIIADYLLSDDYKNYFECEYRNNYSYPYSTYIYQIFKLLNGKYNLYDTINSNITTFEELIESYGLEQLIDLCDVDMESNFNDIEIDKTNLSECQNEIMTLRYKQMIRDGKNYCEIYSLAEHFSVDTATAVLNSYDDEWLIKTTEPIYMEEPLPNNEKKITRSNFIKLYDNDILLNSLLCDSEMTEPIYLGIILNGDNEFGYKVVKIESGNYVDVSTNEKVDNILFTYQLTHPNSIYGYQLNLTTFFKSELFKSYMKVLEKTNAESNEEVLYGDFITGR